MSDKLNRQGSGTSAKFGALSTAREVIARQDLHGCEAAVTGAASGIGVETVRGVVIATRDRTEGESVAATLRKETGSDAIEFALLDLGSLASARRLWSVSEKLIGG